MAVTVPGATRALHPDEIDWAALRERYPEDDGEPMSDNMTQLRYMLMIVGNLEAQYARRPDVVVAGNLLWYADEADPKERAAPDAMVIFGRPKRDRGSYAQWLEGGIAPQVTFEIISPGNRGPKLARK